MERVSHNFRDSAPAKRFVDLGTSLPRLTDLRRTWDMGVNKHASSILTPHQQHHNSCNLIPLECTDARNLASRALSREHSQLQSGSCSELDFCARHRYNLSYIANTQTWTRTCNSRVENQALCDRGYGNLVHLQTFSLLIKQDQRPALVHYAALVSPGFRCTPRGLENTPPPGLGTPPGIWGPPLVGQWTSLWLLGLAAGLQSLIVTSWRSFLPIN
jgi:hypothetical protein